jgi:hypothetical protein
MTKDLLQLFAADQSHDEMADGGANDLRLYGRHLLKVIFDQGPANGREGVAIVERERGEFVAIMAHLKCLADGLSFLTRLIPESVNLFGGAVIGERLYLLRLAKGLVEGYDGIPGHGLEPLLFVLGHGLTLGLVVRFRSEDLIRCNLWTPFESAVCPDSGSCSR